MSIDARWKDGPPTLPDSHRPSPDPVDVRRWVLQHAFWHMLAYQHDLMDEEAVEAELQCIDAAKQLRRLYDSEPRLGPPAADAAIGLGGSCRTEALRR